MLKKRLMLMLLQQSLRLHLEMEWLLHSHSHRVRLGLSLMHGEHRLHDPLLMLPLLHPSSYLLFLLTLLHIHEELQVLVRTSR